MRQSQLNVNGQVFFFFNLCLGPTRCITNLGLVQEVGLCDAAHSGSLRIDVG